MSNNTRYEVVNTMPHFTHLFKGDILYPKQHALCSDCWGHDDEDNPQRWITFCPQFPHLFRPLKWWEGLAIDELPKYVKWGDTIKRVKHIPKEGELVHLWDNKGEIEYIESAKYLDGTGYEYYPANDCVLATEAEYNDYITKLNGK